MSEEAMDKDAAARRIAEAASRALKEAESRRKTPPSELPKELGGRDGPEPTRYGDWEKNGVISDF